MAVLTRRKGPEARRARRDALLARLGDAVEGLLREGGSYADLAVERITSRAEVSRTTFYEYFGDKRELLMSLADRATADLGQAASRWQPNGRDLGRDELREVLRLFLTANRERPLLAALTEAASYDDEVRAAWLAHQDALIGLIEERLLEEQRAGRMPPGPTRATACALHWMVQQTCYQEMVARQRLSEDEYLDTITTLWMRSIRRGD
ncbi:MAG: TetR/AcrR family transcriptional regulator, ethionamide resistance regulator [Thermoleophilaceae bacterium]|jgi:AcrR family transcriptional regulator|nr:TetR/AcrR family transcriptional regulator, ethionamide resistance regulator [Thermoleophilaceae bacterium]MEA2407966.1 TetR/AcrR family transcriptional regulator, ethionamide resistance regulator [Thermoleophilaceae bacterium]